jgi:hypothetical protein
VGAPFGFVQRPGDCSLAETAGNRYCCQREPEFFGTPSHLHSLPFVVAYVAAFTAPAGIKNCFCKLQI